MSFIKQPKTKSESTPTQTLEGLYAQVLGRAPDAGGAAYWNQRFGPTIDANEAAIFKVAAAKEIEAARRAPIAATSQAINEQKAAGQAAAEAARNRPTQSYTSNVSVNDLYMRVLGRAPENQAAVDYWNNAFGESIDASEVLAFQQAAQAELNKRQAGTTSVQSRVNSAADDALKALQIQMAKQFNAMQAAAEEQASALQQLMAEQQSQYMQQLEQSRLQQLEIQKQATEQRRQSEALQRAYVPNLEPTAAAPSMGDTRPGTSRSASQNTLSNLSILTGVGGSGPSSAVSALAGLQIA